MSREKRAAAAGKFTPRQSAVHVDAWLENHLSSDWAEDPDPRDEDAQGWGFPTWEETYNEETDEVTPGMRQWVENLLLLLQEGVAPVRRYEVEPFTEYEFIAMCDEVMHLDENLCGCEEVAK